MEQVQTRSLIEALTGLLGLWLLVRRVPDYVSSLFIVLSGREHIPGELLQFHGVLLAANVFLGALLILLRKKFSGWLAPPKAVTLPQACSFIAVGTAIIGVYFMAQGVTSLGESFAVHKTPNTTNPYLLWRGIFSLGVGLCLFIGSVGVSRLWDIVAGLRRADV